DLGYGSISIPDSVFEHDLQLDRALEMIRSLKKKAESSGLAFGVKLSNTLAMSNHRKMLPGDEMYMSGRALYPITLNLFHLLVDVFNGDLNVSYSGGADALNVSDIIACGALPVTMASDLLKPGGYSRSLQALQELQMAMVEADANDLAAFSLDRQEKLQLAAYEARRDRRYHKTYHPYPLPKVSASLEKYDCIAAPCVEQCAVRQDIPEYAWYIQNGDYDAALQVILSRNPLPGVTGYVCTHLCQERCTRNNYDEPVQIRALKRFAVENGKVSLEQNAGSHGVKHKVAVIGSGPSGLAAAYYLTLSGVSVTIFESRNKAGGMLAIAPVFRLPSNIVEQDIDRIIDLGVDLRLGHSVDGPPESLLDDGYDAVYVATGYQKDATLGMPGEEGLGVYSAMDLLRRAANKDALPLGDNVLVIGGGNTAMDAARVAQRLIGKPVTVVYRRTQAEMPATDEELDGLLDEGNQIEELLSPQRVVLDEGKVVALKVIRNRLGPPDPDGRRRPIPVPGTEFEMPADSVIIAIGQRPEISFLDGSNVTLHPWGAIEVKDDGTAGHVCILAGGDAVRGPATIVEACADGRRAAETIMAQIDKTFVAPTFPAVSMTTEQVRKVKLARSRKQPAFEPALLPPAQRQNFDLVETSYSDEQAREEAARCLQCSSLCDKCVEVCPNRANQVYFIKTGRYEVPVVVANGTGIEIRQQETVSIEQERQILHLDDLCNACGNCTTFCVHQGQPFKDKPRLFLLRETFEAETDNAYLVEGDTIWCRDDGNEYQLTMSNQGRQLKCNNFTLSLDHVFNVTDSQLHESFAGELSLAMALEMNWILQAARQAFPGLIN
ncbi:MAG: FAD-dependent oxidoreductase, partial [Chloroflexota bacterium]